MLGGDRAEHPMAGEKYRLGRDPSNVSDAIGMLVVWYRGRHKNARIRCFNPDREPHRGAMSPVVAKVGWAAMARKRERAMRAYWDERAQLNAPWYVDTSLSFDDPDMSRFFASGEETVAFALEASPRLPERRAVALEVGAGLGRICRALLGSFDRVIGVDISAEMLSRARALVPDQRVSFILGGGSDLGAIRDASIDLVITFTVFQHIPDVDIIERYVAEVGRVLRPGGVFVLQWNNLPGEGRWALKRVLSSALSRAGVARDPFGRHAPEFMGTRVPLKRMRRALEDANLDVLATRHLGTLFAFAWAERKV